MAQKTQKDNKVSFANRPPSGGGLNILTVNPIPVVEPAVMSSPALKSETSWDGLTVPPTDPTIQTLMGKNWFEITSSPFGLGTPSFPVQQTPVGTPSETGPSPKFSPLTDEKQREEVKTTVTLAEEAPAPASVSSRSVSPPEERPVTKTVHTFEDEPEPFADEHDAFGTTQLTSSYNNAYKPAPPANWELEGYVSFIPYDPEAFQSEIPTAQMVGAVGSRRGGPRDPNTVKLFFGHLWSHLPTGCLQWLLKRFCKSRHEAFAPQLHFNKDGWFKGCLHVSVRTQDPNEIIQALHKRILFDHSGVWYAADREQQAILDEYCKRLRTLPQHMRHTKLQSLPCNPMACEFAQNE